MTQNADSTLGGLGARYQRELNAQPLLFEDLGI